MKWTATFDWTTSLAKSSQELHQANIIKQYASFQNLKEKRLPTIKKKK